MTTHVEFTRFRIFMLLGILNSPALLTDQVQRIIKLAWNHVDQNDPERKQGHYGSYASIILEVIQAAQGQGESLRLDHVGLVADALILGWDEYIAEAKREREERVAALRAKYQAHRQEQQKALEERAEAVS